MSRGWNVSLSQCVYVTSIVLGKMSTATCLTRIPAKFPKGIFIVLAPPSYPRGYTSSCTSHSLRFNAHEHSNMRLKYIPQRDGSRASFTFSKKILDRERKKKTAKSRIAMCQFFITSKTYERTRSSGLLVQLWFDLALLCSKQSRDGWVVLQTFEMFRALLLSFLPAASP